MIDSNNKTILFGIIFLDCLKAIDNLTSAINQDVKFVDIQTWKVYEHYTINGENILNLLGFFDSVFQYKSIMKTSFVERRSNFHGYKMKAMVEEVGKAMYIMLYIIVFTCPAKPGVCLVVGLG